jgi:predicted phosphodiesterase
VTPITLLAWGHQYIPDFFRTIQYIATAKNCDILLIGHSP